ncbi:MAG: ABC transporter permease [Agriterribacter sp.]
MLKNYFKTAWRHLFRHKLYSTINATGLAIGITCTLLAVLYWKDEHSFDGFHKNNPYLFRITSSQLNEKGERNTVGNTGHVHGPAFKAGVPEVKEMTRVLGGDISTTLVYGNKTMNIKPLWVDSSFFEVFTFQFLRGNPAGVLNEINSIVITESTARKFFNSIDVVGKVFTQDADPSFDKLQKPLVVTAVVKDPPGNSSLQFDALMTFSFMELSFQNDNWLGAWLGTFVVMHAGADLEKVKEKFNAIYDKHAAPQLINPEYNWMKFDPKTRYGLQPMTDVHFNTKLTTTGWNEGGIVNVASPVYSYVFMGIAIFILLMAAINFINISIAGSLRRTKEIGIRKIAGSNSIQIIFQFLFESAILCCISFVASILLGSFLLPVFNNVTGKQLTLNEAFDGTLVLYFAVLLLTIVLLTGLYPAFILSRFEAVKVLYNKQKLSNRNLFGHSLVVLQFSLAIFLVAGAIVYYSQMNFIRTKNLGYNPSHIITTEVGGARGDYAPILGFIKNELNKDASISSVSFGNQGEFEDLQVNGRKFSTFNKAVDEQFLNVMTIPLLAGRNLDANHNISKNEALVNEAFVKASGMSSPIGQTVFIDRGYDSVYKTIVGVFKDYHYRPLRESIKPMMLHGHEDAYQGARIWVKFEKVNQQKAMAALEKSFKAIMPTAVYTYNFVDEKNASEYLQERRWQKVVNFASLLAFILCCLGLFGLTHLATQQRIKEIGVRKVLGASVLQIITLFTKGFLKLVVISAVVSLPFAWLATNKWLENFAYRTPLSWWIFALAGMIAVGVAITTVGFQAIKAAIASPVKALRTE